MVILRDLPTFTLRDALCHFSRFITSNCIKLTTGKKFIEVKMTLYGRIVVESGGTEKTFQFLRYSSVYELQHCDEKNAQPSQLKNVAR